MLQFLTKGLMSLFAVARLFFCLKIGEFGLTEKINKQIVAVLFVDRILHPTTNNPKFLCL